jgi:rod shape determining protein RodA
LGRADRAELAVRVDFVLLFAGVVVAAIGAVAVFSVTRVRAGLTGGHQYALVSRQVVWVLVGSALLALVARVDYRRLIDLAPGVYGAVIFMLVAVMSPFGRTAKGSQRWFSLGPLELQPSAFASLAVVLILAWYCDRHRVLLGRHAIALVTLAAVPMLLVAIQPDLGTALVIAAITITVLIVAGVRPRHLVTILAAATIAMAAVVQLGVLHHYQVQRLTAFVNQGGDAQGSTYNLDQSMTTIGSGGLVGRGLFHGTQTNLGYVPEQQTDFIFTAIGEQFGFAGSAAIVAAFGVIVWRLWVAARTAKDQAGCLLCAGIVGFVAFEVFENIGMTMGIMPITGIPLPLVSYGGSATIAALAGLGLALNVRARRFN